MSMEFVICWLALGYIPMLVMIAYDNEWDIFLKLRPCLVYLLAGLFGPILLINLCVGIIRGTDRFRRG